MTDLRSVFEQLMATIEQRKAEPSERSYTCRLMDGGSAKIGAKILEEAAEVVEAAAETQAEAREHLIHEAGDLLYHLFVMLAFREIRLPEVEAELARRFGVSGLDEKEARSQPLPPEDRPEQPLG